jgi:hypothetical protein
MCTRRAVSARNTAAWPRRVASTRRSRPPHRCTAATPCARPRSTRPRLRTGHVVERRLAILGARRDDQRARLYVRAVVQVHRVQGCAHVSFAAPFRNHHLRAELLGLRVRASREVQPEMPVGTRDSFRCGSSSPPATRQIRLETSTSSPRTRRTRRRRAPPGRRPR